MPLCLAQAHFAEPGRAGLHSAHFHHPSFPPHSTLASCSQRASMYICELRHALPSLAAAQEAGTGHEDEKGLLPFP